MLENTLSGIQITNFGLVCALIGLSLFMLAQSWFRQDEYHAQFLVLFYLSNLMSQLDELVGMVELWKEYPWLTNLYIPALYVFAPACYLYVKSITTPLTPTCSWWKNIHWSGFIVALIFCTPYFFLEQSIKLDRLIAPAGTLEHLHFITLGPKIALIGFVPFSLFYLVLVVKRLPEHLNNIKSYFSNIQDKDLSWLRWSIMVLFLALLVSAFQLFLPSSVTEQAFLKLISLTFEFGWIAAFSILAIKQKTIYQSTKEIGLVLESSKLKEPVKYSRSQISEEDSLRIQHKLINAMEVEFLYRDSNLTLRSLSDATGISENRISQVFTTKIQLGFYDFVNSWRIKDACIKMKKTNDTILDIAYAVGFNSRSTFNTAFKKHTGQTPSKYRNLLGSS